MRAGLLKNRMTIQVRSTVADGEHGGRSTKWTESVTIYADIIPLSGHELFAAQAIHNKSNVKVVIRYRAGITAAMRLVHNDVIYDIHNVPPVPDSRHNMTLICSTGVTKG